MNLFDDECPVCFEPIATSATFHPCLHKFCHACAQRSLRCRIQCPLCRQTPFALETSAADDDGSGKSLRCVVRVRPTEHVGITVADSKFGVKVIRLQTQDAAFRAGIRRNDVILSMNKLPCRSHKETIQMWDAATSRAETTGSDVQVTCTIERSKPLNAKRSSASSFYRSMASHMKSWTRSSTSND